METEDIEKDQDENDKIDDDKDGIDGLGEYDRMIKDIVDWVYVYLHECYKLGTIVFVKSNV